jgi:hypothetical protein
MTKQLAYFTGVFLLLFVFIPGCEKEYSYEGGPVIVTPDSTGGPAPPKPWVCPACIGQNDYTENKWSFYIDSSFYCGIIDTAIVLPARTGFTFFGPSACSADSGMVITVSMEGRVLNTDYFNITTVRVGYYYYDNIIPTLPLVSRPGSPFSLTMESYIHQTRTATGRFSGVVFKPDGTEVFIHSGKFKVKLL